MNAMLRLLGSVFLVCGVASAACAQTAEQRAKCERDFTPRSGQAGKDVVWVPTPDELVTAMLEAANVTRTDIVYDLGAGDGKIAIAAAKDFGARAVGIEYDPKMAKLATCLVAAAGVADKVRIIEGDIFKTDFSAATVVTLYLLPSLNIQLIPTLLKMPPGTRVVSHSFVMGDWRPDQRILNDESDHAYLWIIPAQVGGTWRLSAPGREPLTIRLRQRFQELEGVVIENGREMAIHDAAVRGTDFAFTYIDEQGATKFNGTVDGKRMTATLANPLEKLQYAGSSD